MDGQPEEHWAQYTYYAKTAQGIVPTGTLFSPSEPTPELVEQFYQMQLAQVGLGLPRPQFYSKIDLLPLAPAKTNGKAPTLLVVPGGQVPEGQR